MRESRETFQIARTTIALRKTLIFKCAMCLSIYTLLLCTDFDSHSHSPAAL